MLRIIKNVITWLVMGPPMGPLKGRCNCTSCHCPSSEDLWRELHEDYPFS